MFRFVLVTFLAFVRLNAGQNSNNYADDPAIKLFRQYLRINTTTNNDLNLAVDFWWDLADQADVPFDVYEFDTGYPVLVLFWEGLDPSLPSIMLNSHMDVVPAEESEWEYPPFEAIMTENGDIYARGSQDMKCVSIQYYEALKRIKSRGYLLRNVYMTLMPDEEIGSPHGMHNLLASDIYKSWNVGCELDEGAAFPSPLIPVFYHDKSVWVIQIVCHGEGGHGSSFAQTNTTAVGKCVNVINTLAQFRDEQYRISQSSPPTNAGNFTSINLNKITAGIANNVIPDQVTLIYDIRLAINIDETQFEAYLRQLITSAEGNITFIEKDPQTYGSVANSSNPYFVALNEGAAEHGVTILPAIPPGSTDSRFVRSPSVSGFGISPMPNTQTLLHSENEYLNAGVFLDGIDFYDKVITKLGNLTAH